MVSFVMISLKKLNALLAQFDLHTKDELIDIRMEALSLLPTNAEINKFAFKTTKETDSTRLFKFGCDYVNLRFEEQFEEAMK